MLIKDKVQKSEEMKQSVLLLELIFDPNIVLRSEKWLFTSVLLYKISVLKHSEVSDLINLIKLYGFHCTLRIQDMFHHTIVSSDM